MLFVYTETHESVDYGTRDFYVYVARAGKVFANVTRRWRAVVSDDLSIMYIYISIDVEGTRNDDFHRVRFRVSKP